MATAELKYDHCSEILEVTPQSAILRCKVCDHSTPGPAIFKQLPNNSDRGVESCRRSSKFSKLKNKLAAVNALRNKYESLNYVDTTSGGVRYKKRAVLCGVSYKKQRCKLKETINDVKEEEQNPNFTPTRKNIQKALQWLVQDCQSGDSLVFYYSGHGSRQLDSNNDELDGFDETICPVDFMTEGMILDNDINSTIVQPLKHGVTLHAIVDACHSGTILDLIYVYHKKMEKWLDNSPPSGANKRTSGGLAICFSACEDRQLAAGTSALSGNEMNGAMTYSLIKAVRENPEQTYGNLLESMNMAIERANESGFLHGRLNKLFKNMIYQNTQLSSTEVFDIYAKKFKL